MPKLVQLGVPLLHGMIGNRLWNLAVAVISSMTTRSMETLLVATFAITLVQKAGAQGNKLPDVQTRILRSASSSWDGEPYRSYPSGQPELSVLKITLAPHTQLEWHGHPMPSAAYIVAGKLTLERKEMARNNALPQGRWFPRRQRHSIEEQSY